MTREDAFYYECLLAIGYPGEYGEWLDSALESGPPFSDITLELVDCRQNVNSIISVLREYRSDQLPDEEIVLDKLRQFLKKAYHSGQMTKDEVVSSMLALVSHAAALGPINWDLWGSMDTFIDYYDLAKDGILAWDTVDSALFDFLDNGIPLDSEKIWGSISG